MSYIRVLPRDLFNEASLLKCLGGLWIQTEGLDGGRFLVDDVAAFDIQQDPNDGSLFVANLPFALRARLAHLSRPLNSREPWPLYLSIPEDPDFEVIAVFNDNGSLSDEMLNAMRVME